MALRTLGPQQPVEGSGPKRWAALVHPQPQHMGGWAPSRAISISATLTPPPFGRHIATEILRSRRNGYTHMHLYTHIYTQRVMCIYTFPLLLPTIIMELLYLLKPRTSNILLETPLDLPYIRLCHVQALRVPLLSSESVRSFTPHHTAPSWLLKDTTLTSLQK